MDSLFEKDKMPWNSAEKLPLSKYLECFDKDDILKNHTRNVIYWTYLIVHILKKIKDAPKANTKDIVDGLNVENNFDKKICELIIDEVLKKIQEFDTDKTFKCTTKPSELKEFDEKEEAFLLTCALYHDIGKLFIKARHGQEGADIIKDIGDDELILFNNLNIDAGTEKRPIRKNIVFISNLIRYHDYYGTLQTGEASYLLFLDVLNPIINNSLINFESKFLRYLLFLNIADILATFFYKHPKEDERKEEENFKLDKVRDCFIVLINDYKKIEYIKIDYDTEISENLDPHHEIQHLILSRNLNHLVNELRQISEDTTCERFRRLLRTTCISVLESGEYKKKSGECKKYYNIKKWFKESDVKPIVSALRDVNWSEIEFRYFAFICKIDYGLSFLNTYFEQLILSEIDNRLLDRKSPHDLRLDLAMNTVELVDVFVRSYGNLTQGKIRLGLGLERLNDIIRKDKELKIDNGDGKNFQQKLIARLKGDKGLFKKAESYEKIKTGVNIWPYLP